MKKFFWSPKVRVPIVLATWFALALLGWQLWRFVAVVFLLGWGH